MSELKDKLAALLCEHVIACTTAIRPKEKNEILELDDIKDEPETKVGTRADAAGKGGVAVVPVKNTTDHTYKLEKVCVNAFPHAPYHDNYVNYDGKIGNHLNNNEIRVATNNEIQEFFREALPNALTVIASAIMKMEDAI